MTEEEAGDLNEENEERNDDLFGVVDEKELENELENDDEENKKKEDTNTTTENLYYDPDLDKQNENWMSDKRSKYKSEESKESNIKSDAILSCPACFVTVCVDCQRHDLYKNQFRAMFVLNCVIDKTQFLRYERKNVSKKRRKKHGPGKLVEYDPSNDETGGTKTLVDVYNPVQCNSCKTEIAVYDTDEIYHFFNVVESIS